MTRFNEPLEEPGYESYFVDPPERGKRGRLSLKLTGDPRRLAMKELGIWLAALSHDHQLSTHMALKLIQMLAAPDQISVHEAIRRLHDVLAIQRARLRFGRVWSFEQLRRLAYHDPRSFMRIGPAPVTDEEILTYQPRNAPKPGEHDPDAYDAGMRVAKARKL